VNALGQNYFNRLYESSRTRDRQTYHPVLFVEGGGYDPRVEQGLGIHRSIGVGDPMHDSGSDRDTYTFALDRVVLTDGCIPVAGIGAVHTDREPGPVIRWIELKEEEVEPIRYHLQAQVGMTGLYGPLEETCRSWTDDEWETLLDRYPQLRDRPVHGSGL